MEIDLLKYAASMQCQELHMKIDEDTQLMAIIAIHNTTLGPALGGCRCLEYPSSQEAAVDAIRLAQAMTYKAAIANLALGGGKMVILRPKIIPDRVAFFKAVGRFVDSLQGRYITAVDSGTSTQDMDIIATETPYVTSTSTGPFSISDPSVMAALGVKRGIEAAVNYKLHQKSLKGIHVAIQGLGHAGYNLAKFLHEEGAKLTVYDVDKNAMQRCINEFGAKSVASLEELLQVECDVFAPCALGGILTEKTVSQLKAPIIAGSANNQLLDPSIGLALMEKGKIYVPDYVLNAGGLIYVAAQYSQMSEFAATQKIEDIYNTAMEILIRSKAEKRPTSEIADTIAEERVVRAANVLAAKSEKTDSRAGTNKGPSHKSESTIEVEEDNKPRKGPRA